MIWRKPKPHPQQQREPSKFNVTALSQMQGEKPEVDFGSTPIADIVELYLANGCVLLRGFADPDRLAAMMETIDDIYEQTDSLHITAADLANRGLRPLHEAVFTRRHNDLLGAIFGDWKYRVHPDTVSRRVTTGGQKGSWMAPLGPHLDVFFHPFAFTANFWVPFRNCGVDAPSLGVVRATFDEMISYVGYDGGPEGRGVFNEWNLPRFFPPMHTMAMCSVMPAASLLRPTFQDRVWTPEFALGDAMLLSNWTLHFSHATPAMTQRRGNVELRFYSGATLDEVRARKKPTDINATSASR